MKRMLSVESRQEELADDRLGGANAIARLYGERVFRETDFCILMQIRRV